MIAPEFVSIKGVFLSKEKAEERRQEIWDKRGLVTEVRRYFFGEHLARVQADMDKRLNVKKAS